MKIQTLIELYDERPLENVLGVEVCRPEQVIYIRRDNVFIWPCKRFTLTGISELA